ncbi:MAG: creatininase family protein [Anaerolineae bacterium]|nr:creatininase family protein [Anaerolineae bacterium]
MRYELMFPHQIRRALDENWPAVLPVGVLEYHSEHCVVGVDTLLVVRAVEALEQEMDLVVLPPYYYGAASYVVEPPERRGSVQVDSDVIHLWAREVFRSFLRIGFRNLHVFIHHQSENFAAGMPTDLAFRLAARQAIFEYLDGERGEGWWGDNESADYYAEHAEGANPFNWIRVHPFMDAETQARFPIDHAGKQETSLMLGFCPEGVDLDRIDAEKWYAREAREANQQYAREAREMILASMRRRLGKD